MISGNIWSRFYNCKKVKLILPNKRNVLIFILNYIFDFKLLFGLVECTLLRILIWSEDAGMKRSWCIFFAHRINFIRSACERERFVLLFQYLFQAKQRIGVWGKGEVSSMYGALFCCSLSYHSIALVLLSTAIQQDINF